MTHFVLSEIWIYPIKSLGGIRLEKATVQAKGLQSDRRWMLIDEAGVAMTQRVYPTMALFKPALQDGKISVLCIRDHQEVSSVSFSTATLPANRRVTAKIWDDEVEVLEVDPEINEWFSLHLGITCTLVAFPEGNIRHVDPNYSVNGEQVSLADAYPFLIIGQRSLDDLNQRLNAPVPMNRFRPNFVFTGGEPFAEDKWRNITIGNLPFVAVKKSARCVLTTVDQDKGEKGSEPLKTLSSYRKVDNKVFLGQNMVALAEGEVHVGDRVIPA